MVSPQLQNIIQMLRNAPLREDNDFAVARTAIETTATVFPTPEDVVCEPVDADGVPAEWISAPGADAGTVVYYLHGGGYTIGSINSHRELVSRISRASGARAFAIDYRLAPEHPFPAGLEDAVSAYRWLLAEGVEPSRVVIGGDSAGGGLALATLLMLRDAGDPLPGAAFLISPFTDLEGTGESGKTRAAVDPMIKMESLKSIQEAYAPGRDLRDPLLSPYLADLSGLPPMLIHVGDHEVILDDSTRLEKKAKADGVDVTLEVWPEMIHVWHFFGQVVPEGREATERIGAWIREKIGAPVGA